jgi:DNA-binding transcriptional regulator GbsR (MarR family)
MKTKKPTHPYGYVANTIINNENLSFNAKGVYLYILSKPDSWDFSHERIAKSSTTSRHAVRSAIQELEDRGLLKRKKLKTGRMVYFIVDPVYEQTISKSQSPNLDSGSPKAKVQIRNLQNPQLAESDTISKKEEYKAIKRIQSNTDTSIKFLENIEETEAQEIAEKYNTTAEFVRGKAEDLLLYCQSKGRKYKNYRALLQGAVRRDAQKVQERITIDDFS